MSDGRLRLHCPIPSTIPRSRKSEGTDLLEGFGWQNEDSGGFFGEWVGGGFGGGGHTAQSAIKRGYCAATYGA